MATGFGIRGLDLEHPKSKRARDFFKNGNFLQRHKKSGRGSISTHRD
jgi:hypothetical protein